MGFPSGKSKTGEYAKRPRPGCPLDKDIIAKQITLLNGNLSRVADSIGASRGAVRNVVDRHVELQELLRQARERQLDQLEQSCFDRAIESNDTTLQLFLLKTQGKSRGYDQSDTRDMAKDIANAAFEFIVNKSKA